MSRHLLWVLSLVLPWPLGADVSVVTDFPEASPVAWEVDGGTVRVELVQDRERHSTNVARNHWHFALVGPAGAGVSVRLEGIQNVYNGKPTFALGPRAAAWVVAEDGDWQQVPLTRAQDGLSASFRVALPATGRLRVARLPTYGLTELEALLLIAQAHPAASLGEIGRSVEGRSLTLLSLGRTDAPTRVLIRARAHPWEAGTSWVVDAFVRAWIARTQTADDPLSHVAFDIIPMANPDGVAAGRSRFNAAGTDLNRHWLQPADAQLAPENAALETWLVGRQAAGVRHAFFVDLHNDNYGKIHTGRAPTSGEDYAALVARYEALLRRDTWFSEGVVSKEAGNPGTSVDGMAIRFGIPGVVQELHGDWIAGRDTRADIPLWREFGAALPGVLAELVVDGR